MKTPVIGWNLVVAWCLLAATSLAQGPAPQAGQPGGVFRGQFIGFVPQHQRTPATYDSDLPSAMEFEPVGDYLDYPDGQACDAGCCDAGCDAGCGAGCDAGCDTGCDAGCHVVGCDAPCPGALFWARADYLLWWTKGMGTPALVTTSFAGTPQERAGVLGDPDTSILFGTEGVNGQSRSGGRVTIGRWLDPEFCHGFDVTYVWLAEESDGYRGSADGLSILARPFYNTESVANDSRLIVYPELVDGALAVSTSTDFRSLEAVLRRSMIQRTDVQTDYFIGYRYAELEDLVRVDESTISLSGPIVDSTFRLFDQFDTQNEFHGGELGIRILRHKYVCWSLELTAQVALGSTSSKVWVAGQTEAVTPDGQSQVTDSGMLVQSTNAGTYDRDTFSTLSEVGLSLRRQFACGLAARFGYTFLYWSDVLRAGEQIDLAINPTQIPPGTLDGPARPALPLDTAGFWAQGLHFGLDYRY